MIIKNFVDLATDNDKQVTLKILESGLVAGLPKNVIQKFVYKSQISIGKCKIPLSKYDQIYLVAFGKAADSMVCEVNSLTRTSGGIIVIPEGYTPLLQK